MSWRRTAVIFVALIGAFMLVGGAVALAGAAVWKGELPGEGDEAPRAAVVGAPVPSAVRDRAAASTPPPATQRPGGAGFPVVLDIVICDVTVDCGEDPARREWDAVVACLRVRAGTETRPLVLVATARETPPTGAEDAAVIARSAAIRASETLACHNVRAVGRPLPPGQYSMWLLDGSVALRQVRFRLGR